MTNIEEAKARAAAAERLRTMEAMERLVIDLGTRVEYVQWLDIFPETISLDSGGGVSREDMQTLAADEAAFTAASKAWAAIMLPVMETL